MGAIGGFPGQLQHFRTQRSDDGLRCLCGWQALVRCAGHAFEVLPHGGNRWTVIQTTNTFHQRLVRNTEAEQETTAGLLIERVVRRQRHARFTVVDVGDSGRQVQGAGVGQQPAGVHQWVPTHRFGNPEGAIAEGFDTLGGFCRRRGR